ncbi:MAG: zinc ribbon domain-containing protein [Blastocatellia bacterium]|nr:zinc ribbon domain-containing protein [Blastocatellia bacterium]
MPIYEYDCSDCGRHFEALVFGERQPECPSCSGKNLTQTLSVFAVSSGGKTVATSQPLRPCGTCGDPRGPGACSMN